MQASGTTTIRLGIEVADSFKRTSLLQGGIKMSECYRTIPWVQCYNTFYGSNL
jgi:hypothetical protein